MMIEDMLDKGRNDTPHQSQLVLVIYQTLSAPPMEYAMGIERMALHRAICVSITHIVVVSSIFYLKKEEQKTPHKVV